MDNIKKYLAYLEYEKMYSSQTLRAYKTDITLFKEYLQDQKIETTTKKTARAYIMTLIEKGKSPKSINRNISSLRGFFTFLTQQKLQENNPLTPNPFATISNIKQGERLPKFLEQKDMATIVEELKCVVQTSESFFQVSKAMVVLFLYFTGLRRSEACQLKVTSINNSTIRVLGKGKKERIVPLNKEILSLLTQYIEKRNAICCKNAKDSLFLIEQRGGKIRDMTPNDIYIITNQLLKTNPHTLRHTFATHLMQNKVGIRTIQELLGHSSINSTEIYAHNTIESLKQSYNNAHPRAKKPKGSQN